MLLVLYITNLFNLKDIARLSYLYLSLIIYFLLFHFIKELRNKTARSPIAIRIYDPTHQILYPMLLNKYPIL